MSLEQSISYEEAKKLVSHDDPEVRKKLAARDDVSPEILYFLAEDKSAEVRQNVAKNAKAPRQTHSLLAQDEDADVRCGLAEKLSRVAPDLSDDDRDKIRQSTHDALGILARDQISVVRQILSETLKDVANISPEVIRRLAMDSEIEVAGPVLEYSPVLTDDDLIEIVNSGPTHGGLGAVSRRNDVSELLADAIVATDDVNAIADLLGNDTAQIREQTLDDLIDRADNVDLWHAPLVSRPALPPGAVTRLARFVADDLLDQLTARDDLDEETLNAVKSMVRRRIGAAPGKSSGDDADIPGVEPPIEVAQRLLAAGRLDAKVLSKALASGDKSLILASLSVLTGLALPVIKEVFASHSAKGVVSLVWKAGLPMQLAVQAQQRMAGIAPGEIIEAGQKGEFPFTDDQMNWQISSFSDGIDEQN